MITIPWNAQSEGIFGREPADVDEVAAAATWTAPRFGGDGGALQLVGVNQSDEVKPVQSIARDGVVANNASPSAAMEVVPSSAARARFDERAE